MVQVGEHEVLLRMKAAPINPSDLISTRGNCCVRVRVMCVCVTLTTRINENKRQDSIIRTPYNSKQYKSIMSFFRALVEV